MKKLVLAVLLLVGTAVYADTLTFTGSTANGEYGPYSMSLNGTATQMVCFSDNNWISGGESWTVQAFNITQIAAGQLTGAFSGTTTQYNELGYLANELFANPGNADLQLALWSVFGLSSPFVATAGSMADASYALSQVNSGYVTTDVFYIPVGPNLPLVNGTTPQPFISAPEPSSLALLMSGMLAMMLLLIPRGRA
jgi:hypothetical protein